MWTRENRGLYERKGVRYPSDLTDREWALIAPLIPPAKRGGRRREVDVREVMNGFSMFWGPAASGVRCRKTCRRRARCTTISRCGKSTIMLDVACTSGQGPDPTLS